MFCRRCYAPLRADDAPRCPACGRLFDPAKPLTFLQRPFPSGRRIVVHLVATTVLGIVAAFVISLHQAAQMSGH